jgi:DNA polymerase sigma
MFFRSGLICKSFVLSHTSVPIANFVERPFNFNIDICVSNVNPHYTVVNPIFPPLYFILRFDESSKSGKSNPISGVV